MLQAISEVSNLKLEQNDEIAGNHGEYLGRVKDHSISSSSCNTENSKNVGYQIQENYSPSAQGCSPAGRNRKR